MASRVIRTPVKIDNIDPEVCRLMGGKVTSDGKCMLRMIVNEEKPRHITIEGINEDELRD